MVKFLTKYMFLFFLFALIGWLYEYFFRMIVHHEYSFPGSMLGPWLPIYGGTVCLFYFVCDSFEIKMWQKIIVMGLVVNLMELIVGAIAFYGSGLRYWDYSNLFLNINGFVALPIAIAWTAIAAVFALVVYPYLRTILDRISQQRKFSFFTGILFGIFLGNLIHTIFVKTILK